MPNIRFNSNLPNITISYENDWGEVETIPLNTNFSLSSGYVTLTGVLDEGFEIIEMVGSDDWGEAITNISIDELGFTVYFYLNSDTIFDVVLEMGFVAPIREVSGFNKVYLVDNDIIRSLSLERFIEGGEFTSRDEIDLGVFIINVLELPFPVDVGLLHVASRIKLGYDIINTEAIELLSDILTVDVGTISIPHKFNNSYDYINTEIKLHLPFVDTIDLDVEYVVGFDITISYLIDLYSGENTVNLISSKTNKPIYSSKFKVGRSIPFITSKDRIINSIGDSSGLENGVDSAFIEVIRNVPNGLLEFNDVIVAQGVLNGEVGQVSVNNMSLESSATVNEKNLILNILKSGVYIK